MTVRAVVVTYNSGEHVVTFLDSLAEAGLGTVPVTIVDNGSTDGAPEAAAQRAEVSLVRPGANLGYGGGANRGVEAVMSTGDAEEWVLIANPDVSFEPGSLAALLDAAARWPTGGVLGPRIHTADGMVYPSARQIPSIGRGIGHAVFGWLWPTNPWTVSYRQEKGEPVERVAGWLSGSCLLVRRVAFDAVGGFDEGFFMYFEDLDLCERIAAAGWLNVYAPSAIVMHIGAHSTDGYRDAMTRAHHASAYRYLSRRYRGPRYAALRFVLRVGLGARYLLSTVVHRVSHGARPTRAAAS